MFDVYREVVELSESAPASVFYPAARYGQLCLQALTEPWEALVGMRKLAQWCAYQRWDFAVLRCNLAAFKLHAENSRRDEQYRLPRSAAARVLKIARKFHRQYRSPYWYADGAATAYALGKMSNCRQDWLAGVRAEAECALTRIGRLDKLMLSERATSADFFPIWLLAE